MSLWNVYVGCYTKEFLEEIERLNAKANIFWQGQLVICTYRADA